MTNTSAIFKGSRTKLLTKDGLGLEAGQTIKVIDGAAVNAVPVSDAQGVLTVQALPAAAVPNLDASKITSGTLDIARIPSSAMEHLVYVADQPARYALTTASVQNGDSVYQNDTLTMYIVIDDTKLNVAAGYQVYMTNCQWANVQSKPAYVTQAATDSLDGYLTAADHTTFAAKQPAGSYITALTSEVTASGPGSATATVANSAVIGKVLTGLTPADGAPVAGDTILQAIGKLDRVAMTDASNQALSAGFNATSIVGAENELRAVMTDIKDPTGFVDGDNITVTYDSTGRTITLTHASGFVTGYYRGKKFSLTSPWVSTAHGVTNGTYWLTISSAGAADWATINTFPGFDNVLVSLVNYGSVTKFAFREVHGCTMDWATHEELHRTIGAYRVSGSQVTAGTFALNTNTVAAVTPGVDVGVIADEDIRTTIAALTDGSTYTRVHIDTLNPVFTTGSTFPFPDDGTDINYNANPTSGTALVPMTTNNRWVNIYGLLAPMTASAGSQDYRILWLTGQQVYTTSALAQAEDFRSLTLGGLSTMMPEIVPYIRLTYRRTGSNLTRNAQFDVNPSYLIGSNLALVSVSGVAPTTSGAIANVTTSFTGNLTSLDTNVQVEADTIDQIPMAKGRNYLNGWNTSVRPIGTLDTGVSFAAGQTRANPLNWAATDVTKLTLTQINTATLDGSFSYQLTNAGAGAASVQTPLFTLGLIDVGTAQTIKFDLSGVALSGDYTVVLDRYDTNNVLQATITPALSTLPTGTGRFSTFAITGSTADDKYALRFSRVSVSDTSNVKIDELYVGPNVQVQCAAIGAWKAYQPTTSGLGTSPSIYMTYREVGSSVEIRGILKCGTSPSGITTFSLPTGYTADYSKTPIGVAGTDAYQTVGWAEFVSSSATNRLKSTIVRNNASSTLFQMYYPTITGGNLTPPTTDIAMVAGDSATIFLTVPVNELSSNVTLANRAVEEYASNSSTSAANDSTSFISGPAGNLIPNITSAGTGYTKRVQFSQPIQATDSVILEVRTAANAPWKPASERFSSYNQGSNSYGMQMTAVSSTQVDVVFAAGGFDSGATYASNGSTWSVLYAASHYWRIRKVSGGASVGYPISSANIVGRTDGVAPAAGMVGEPLGTQRAGTGGFTYSDRATTALTGSFAALISRTLNKGQYLVSSSLQGGSSSGTGSLAYYLAIGTTAVTNTMVVEGAAGTSLSHSFSAIPVTISADGTVLAFYGKQQAGTAAYQVQEMWITRVA